MTRRESIVESVRRSCVQGQHEAGQLQRVVLVARVASQGQPAQQGAALESEVTAVNGSSTVDSDNDEHHDSHEGAANPKLRGRSLSHAYGGFGGFKSERAWRPRRPSPRDEKKDLAWKSSKRQQSIGCGGPAGQIKEDCPEVKHERIQVLQKELAALQSRSSGDSRHGKVPRGKQQQNAGQYTGGIPA